MPGAGGEAASLRKLRESVPFWELGAGPAPLARCRLVSTQRFSIPTAAFTITAAMPIGMSRFQPMFINWS